MGVPKIIIAGPSERQQYFFHKHNDNTVRFVLNYPGLIQPDVLCEAVKTIVESVDILHGTFFTDVASAYWKLNKEVDAIHYFHYIKCSGDTAETAYSLSLFPVFPEDKVQIRVWLVQSEVSSSIVVCISHLCADGGDGKYLLNKIVEAYNMLLAKGNTDELVVKNGSRAPEKLYTELTVKEVMGLVGTQLPKVSSLYPYPTKEGGMVRYLRKTISSEIMEAARKRAKEVGASANDLLVAALTQAYAELEGIDETQPMSITSMMDLRRHCKNGESEGLCNMSGSMPTYMEHGVQGGYEETLKEVAKQTALLKEDPYAGLAGLPMIHSAARNVPMGLLLKFVGNMYAKASLNLTNMGNISCSEYAMGEIIPSGGLFGSPVKKKPGLTIAAMSFDGECVLSVCGVFTDDDVTLLDSTLERMVYYIKTYALG